MWQIAKNLNVTPQDLMENNPQISNPNTLFPGQIIYTPSDDTAPIIPSTPVVPSDIKNLETEVVKLINSERTKAGRAVLTENSNLSNAARLKSEDFVNNKYFSHESPTYGSPFNMLSSLGITYTAAAENIASGQRNAEEVMKYWMNSPGHRANILSSSYNQIGVGVARDQNGNLYWTQLFIKN
ncbi:MAG: LysM peptidoglycan-binding domain-containing protein [Mollicutes bacterium]|nr:LysM peptidoglycan-binding domain-containing protein [Mollicutes bacterium]